MDKARILFLDVDGVLNSRATMKRRRRPDGSVVVEPGGVGDDRRGMYGWDPEHTKLLLPLLELPNFGVVFSTSWRILHPVDELKGFLHAAGCRATVLGVTPRDGPDEIRGLTRSSVRGHQIRAFLREHQKYVESYAVVDDDADMDSVRGRFVQTGCDTGLEARHVKLLKEHLQRPVTAKEWALLRDERIR